jgi:hypothetical protein
MGGSRPVEGGLGHPRATCMSPQCPLLLACLKFPLRKMIPKNSFFGVAEEGSPSSVSASS